MIKEISRLNDDAELVNIFIVNNDLITFSRGVLLTICSFIFSIHLWHYLLSCLIIVYSEWIIVVLLTF